MCESKTISLISNDVIATEMTEFYWRTWLGTPTLDWDPHIEVCMGLRTLGEEKLMEVTVTRQNCV